MAKKGTQSLQRFRVGEAVVVKPGTPDPEFPDLPIGGWAGKVTEVIVGKQTIYGVKWDSQTLQAMPAIYRRRCERDGLDCDAMYLGDDELESDTGQPRTIEQPGEFVSRPLSPDDQDDRVRDVFGLTSDDPLPEVDDESLSVYYTYLIANLSFPFEASWSRKTGPFSSSKENATIVGMHDPDGEIGIDDLYGLMCQARDGRRKLDLPLAELEDCPSQPQGQILGDYAYWFSNYR